MVTGIDSDDILRCVELVTSQWDGRVHPAVPTEYQVLDCSIRVSRLIAGLAGVHANWLGLRPRPAKGTA